MSYLGPFEIEPALEQFRDKLWGLHWSGFLKINDAGAHSFNILISSNSDRTDSYGSISCESWLKLQNRAIADHPLQFFNDGNKNAYGDIDLRPGIYDFEVWLACNKTGGGITPDSSKLSITVNMRGPNDPMLKPIPKNQLLHEL